MLNTQPVMIHKPISTTPIKGKEALLYHTHGRLHFPTIILRSPHSIIPAPYAHLFNSNQLLSTIHPSHGHNSLQSSPSHPNSAAAFCAFARILSTCSSSVRIWPRAALSSLVNRAFSSCNAVEEEGDGDYLLTYIIRPARRRRRRRKRVSRLKKKKTRENAK